MDNNLELIEPGAQRGATSALRAEFAGQISVPAEKTSFLSRFLRKSRAPMQAPREACVMVAVLMILDRGLALDGMVTAANTTSLLFRQASTFIFDRTGAEVSIRFGTHDRRGQIVEVSPDGYVVKLHQPLNADELTDIFNAYGQLS